MKALDPPPHQGGFEKNDTAIDVAAVKAWRSTVAEVTSGQLGLADLASLLTAYGVPMGPMGKAKSPEEAVTIAECMGFPVALKVLSPQILRDPQFGPLVISGIYVEVLADTSARLAPVSPDEARTMLSELELARLLRGVRGEAPVDLAAAAKAVSRNGAGPSPVHPAGVEPDAQPDRRAGSSHAAARRQVQMIAAGLSRAGWRAVAVVRSGIPIPSCSQRRARSGRMRWS
jgi:hypothetical protein